MLFPFFTDLPGDALGAVLTIPLGVGTCTAFFAVALVVFLADGKGFSFWMMDTIHGISLAQEERVLNFSSRRRILSSNSSMACN